MNTREIAAEYRLAHWAQIVRRKNESGLSIKAFCASEGFRENTYYYWQRKLREAACEQLT
ncbi:IS66 family insertion sequence element accessory protein TnpA, partial [Desulforamulus hydrothermalis]